MSIIFCKECVTPSSRPRIYFNNQGICNACTNVKTKKNINWKLREKQFENLISKIKNRDKKKFNEFYDCIVPWSGGKDSSSIALKLKFEYKLNPLLITFSPLIPNEIGQFNRKELINLGFDNFFFSPNLKISKQLSRRFFIERGNPKVAWDAGINTVPFRCAINLKIPYIFYAEHGESEYGGLVISKKSEKIRDETEVIEHLIGDHPENWANKEINISDLFCYIFPKKELIKKNKIAAYYFSYFFFWNMFDNYKYIKNSMKNFKENINGRTNGTFTNFDSLDDKIDSLYYYMQCIKFGFGRATRDASRLIQNNIMTREEAIEKVRLYDLEFPSENFTEVLDFLNIKELDFEEIVNKHRNPEIWKKKNNSWVLRFSL